MEVNLDKEIHSYLSNDIDRLVNEVKDMENFNSEFNEIFDKYEEHIDCKELNRFFLKNKFSNKNTHGNGEKYDIDDGTLIGKIYKNNPLMGKEFYKESFLMRLILEKSIKKRNTKIIKYIVEIKKDYQLDLDLNSCDNVGNTILHTACMVGDEEFTKFLVENNEIDIEKTNLSGENALCCACEAGNLGCVKILLNSNKNNLDKSANKESPFFIACKSGNIEIVKFLIGYYNNIDINKQIDNETAFSIACKTNHLEIVKLLIDSYDIDTDRTINNETPFSIACGSNNIKLIKFLLENYKIDFTKSVNIKSLFFAICKKDNTEIAKFLLENIEININEPFNGKTLFLMACEEGNVEIAKLLSEKPNFRNINNEIEVSAWGGSQIRMFRSLNKEENKIVDIAYNKDKYEENSEDPKTENINEKNDLCKLYEISYLEKIGEYPKKVKYLIDKENNKNFDIAFYEDGRTEFNFDNLGNIDYETFREKLYKILNDFKNTKVFDKYLSWSLYGLAKFKLKDKEDNEKTIFFHNVGTNNIKKIIEDNFDKICIFDFIFSSDDLKEDFNNVSNEKFKKENENSGHAITLMAVKGKILGVNTGFESIKAFKKLKKELKTIQNVEKVFQIPFDIIQKGGTCNIASKFWAEAILSSISNEDSIENSLAKFINNMWIQKKLLKTREDLLKKEKRLKKIEDFLSMYKSANDFKEHINIYSEANNDLAKSNKIFFREPSEKEINKIGITPEKLNKLIKYLENNMPIEEAIRESFNP